MKFSVLISRENAYHILIKSIFCLQLNVHQRSLEAGLEICAPGGSVPQGQPSSAGSVGSAPSPASPRPTTQPRPPLATTTSQPSRTLDDDRSTDGELGQEFYEVHNFPLFQADINSRKKYESILNSTNWEIFTFIILLLINYFEKVMQ